jgi:fructuronate reductase
VTERLSAATLCNLPTDVLQPRYDRSALKSGIVHVGLGAFQRAHQAPIFDALAEDGDLRWGVIGASLRSPAAREALAPQDCLYSLVIEHGSQRTTSVIGVLMDVIVAAQEPERLIEAIASPEARIVTVTVTEKGYKLDPTSGSLIEDDPDVRADLSGLHAPRTLPGFLAAGLWRRRERGLAPLTIVSCDNMLSNGRKLQASVAQVAGAQHRSLADWIEAECAFPNTMVDRIVPATTEEDIDRVSTELGLIDRATVRTEAFSQWVIENRFSGDRPELERAGIQFTNDVAPWEEAKLRLLNGAHSAMAYLGGLSGLSTVDKFVAEPWGKRFIELFWDELRRTLEPPPQLDLPGYCATLMQRFGNSALGHRLTQIAMDGSQKIPQRLVPAATDRLERGEDLDAIALVIAAWMRWQEGVTDEGAKFRVDDPLTSMTARLLEGASSAADKVRALLSLASMFPDRFRQDSRFRSMLTTHLDSFQRIGARATVERFLLVRAGVAHGRARA